MQAFKSGKTQILVATDVAARGLHINKLPYVINYDFPSNLKQYIHRVGRTGRNGASGFSFSFFTRNLAALAPDLIQFLEEHKQPVDQHLKQLID
jgi:ATP-dependent RNA helicase DDX5/DBP2